MGRTNILRWTHLQSSQIWWGWLSWTLQSTLPLLSLEFHSLPFLLPLFFYFRILFFHTGRQGRSHSIVLRLMSCLQFWNGGGESISAVLQPRLQSSLSLLSSNRHKRWFEEGKVLRTLHYVQISLLAATQNNLAISDNALFCGDGYIMSVAGMIRAWPHTSFGRRYSGRQCVHQS